MVKKRGPYDRIEKVVKKKQSINRIEGNSNESSPKKIKNILNDEILSLYKKEASLLIESSVSMNHSSSEKMQPTSAIVTHKQIENTPRLSESSRKPIKNSEKRKKSGFSVKYPTIGFKDVADFDDIFKQLLKRYFPIRDPKLFSALNQSKSELVLLHGPSGCGKTHAVHAFAGEMSLPLLEVETTEIVCGVSGESESKIRDIFEEAVKMAPCILFFDRIDVIVPKSDQRDIRSMEKRMVNQLVKSLDDFKNKGHSANVLVIVATNKVESLDSDFLNRFDCELITKIPDEKARLMILQVLTKDLNLSSDFNLKWIAHHTPGFVGADLSRLVQKALSISTEKLYLKYINQYLDVEKCDNSNKTDQFNSLETEAVISFCKSEFEIPIEEAINIAYSLENFQEALKMIIPSSKREGFCSVPSVTWEDVGALKDIKEEIKELIIWPVKYRKLFENCGQETSKGILLYGPKGCGKTLLAKAIANECSINFCSVKGPELLNMYLGESERAVRLCFQRARNSAPCIIFFDEIDALIPNRSGSNANVAAERVVNQLLTEMDGIEERNEVFIIGATNRPEILDSAVLRPGRLEKIFYVGLPTPDDRADILESLTKNKTKPKISDEVDLKVIAHDSRCKNFSGADLAHLIRTATANAIKECILKNESSISVPDETVEIKLRHFEYAFSKVLPSVNEMELKHFKRIFEEYRH